jgi:hypothetical protein
MWLRSSKSRSHRTSSQRPKAPRHPRLVRPELEVLEGRVLPSTYVVTNLGDDGVGGSGSGLTGDLRYCIAHATSGTDVITFAAGLTGTIDLSSDLPTMNANVTIQGPGASQLTVDRFEGNNFTVGSAATVQISGLTISGGTGIDNAGTLILSNSTITGCVEAIDNSGSATINSCTLSSNGNDIMFWGQNHAIVNTGSVTINYSTLSGNGADVDGGALYNNGTATINSSTLANNGAGRLTDIGQSAYGGAIYQAGGTLAIDSSTISDNGAIGGTAFTTYGWTNGLGPGDGLGGGLYLAAGSVSIDHSTIAGNVAAPGPASVIPGYGYGGGIYNSSGVSLQVHDTIIANNVAENGPSPDLDGSLTSLGHNLIGNTAGGSGFVASDLQNVNPQLAPLQNNGGPTQTMALMPGSPAINAGDVTGAPAFDQRGPGFQRTFNGTIDIGAFEVQNGNSNQASGLAVAGFPTVTRAGSTGSFKVTALNPDGSTDTAYTGTVHFTSSDAKAGLPADYTFTAADAGVHTFRATLKTAGTQSITATDTTTGLTGADGGITVTPAPASQLAFAKQPSTATAGQAISPVVIDVEDEYGNLVSSNSSTVTVTLSGGTFAGGSATASVVASGGVATFSSLTIDKASSYTLTATDGSLTPAVSAPFSVTPAAASKFVLTGPRSISAGVAFSLTLTVEDAYGNVVTGYTGTVHFSSTDYRATLPANYTFSAADKGVHTFTGLVLRKVGYQKITLTDTLNNALTASDIVNVCEGSQS